MKIKIKPGVCGLCGRAQVRPGDEEINKLSHGWISGHLFKCGRLEKVRCFHHAEDYERLVDPKHEEMRRHGFII